MVLENSRPRSCPQAQVGCRGLSITQELRALFQKHQAPAGNALLAHSTLPSCPSFAFPPAGQQTTGAGSFGHSPHRSRWPLRQEEARPSSQRKWNQEGIQNVRLLTPASHPHCSCALNDGSYQGLFPQRRAGTTLLEGGACPGPSSLLKLLWAGKNTLSQHDSTNTYLT